MYRWYVRVMGNGGLLRALEGLSSAPTILPVVFRPEIEKSSIVRQLW